MTYQKPSFRMINVRVLFEKLLHPCLEFAVELNMFLEYTFEH